MITDVYPDVEMTIESYSGAKERELFNKILEYAIEGDYVVVTKLDRFCRSTKEGLQYIDILLNKGVKIHILNMGLIENTPMGRLIVANLLAFAEFEHAMIIERTQSGKTIANQRDDFREGRPPKFNKLQVKHAVEILNSHSYKKLRK